MKKCLIIFLTLSFVFPAVTAASPPAETEKWLQGEVDKTAEDQSVQALIFYVIGPKGEYSAAAGPADPDCNRPMTADTPVRIASVTKTFVAAAALRLSEQGRLDLDASINTLLPEGWIEMLRADGYDTGRIRVRELLNHTGGLFDHSDSENYVELILANPQKRWTAEEQVTKAVEWGDPLAAPGEEYHYADTGYIMLGTILEKVAGKTLSALVREQLDFEDLGLRDTWWEIVEPKPEGTLPRGHQYFDSLDVTFFDASIDLYGGGGLVSTARDMATFFRALFHDRVFDKKTTLERMLSDHGLPADSPYRSGIFAGEIAGHKVYWHSGFWGTYAAHVPSLDCSLAFAITPRKTFPQGKALAEKIVQELARNN